MFFFKRKFKNPLKVDIHSHLLPGIDDGSKNIKESLEMMEKFKKLGYNKLIITPHVMYDNYNNCSELIKSKLLELKSILEDIELEASAEYYMDEEFEKRLEKKDLLPIKNRYILFETSYYMKPNNFEDFIFMIKSLGFIPIFAHPERYRYLQGDIKKYKEIKELGVLFQCNINSIGGHYGKAAQKTIEKLSKYKMIDFLGSDAHSIKHVSFLEEIVTSKTFYKIYSNNNIINNSL